MLLFFEEKLPTFYFCSIFTKLRKKSNFTGSILSTTVLWIVTKIFDILMGYR